jgi:hypothetical protein
VASVTERWFPDDREVDQWLYSQAVDNTDANPIVDQLQAATADSLSKFRAAAPSLVAAGVAERYIETADPDRQKIRGAVRQLMAALSAGVLRLCQHVQQIRPLILVCDPPVVCCAECFASRKAVIETLGHRWNHQCDRCGVNVQMLTPVSIGGLGPITITGQVCSRCAADDQRQASAGLPSRTGNRHARRRGAS